VGNIDVTPKGNIVIVQTNNMVVEYDPDGQIVWKANVAGNRATRLANGNTLVASETAGVVEVDNSVNIGQLSGWMRERYGRVDAIVNNASTAPDLWGIGGTTDLSPVAEALDVNLFGAWRVIQALLPLLRSSPRPRIVNVSSESGAIALMSGGHPAFSVSKAALNALTRTLAGELYRDGILVNAVCPGPVTTDGARSSGRSAAQGAASVVWAVTLPNGGPTGTFTRDGRELPW